jgi:hypothetical protein
MPHHPVPISALQAGDVVLYHSNTVVGFLIRLFDGTDVNHAGLYLGPAQNGTPMVGEALLGGLKRQTLAASYGRNKCLLARRLDPAATTMKPVLKAAEGYLSNGSRYAYEQILLLALLGLTRKIRLTPVLGALLRKILDQAASAVSKAFRDAAGGDPMICSEFVYRSYAEAKPGGNDEYELVIKGLELRRSLALAAEGGAVPPEAGLLAFARQDSDLVTYVNTPTPGESLAELAGSVSDPRALRTLAAAYRKEERSKTTYEITPQSVLEEARGSLRSLAQVLHSAQGKPSGEALGVIDDTPFGYLAAVADFVTPGDLFLTTSLETKGAVKL